MKYVIGSLLILASVLLFWITPYRAEAACAELNNSDKATNINIYDYNGYSLKYNFNAQGMVRTDIGLSTGKWYWEVLVDSGNVDSSLSGWNGMVYGISRSTTATSTYPGADATSYGIGASAGQLLNNALARAVMPVLVADDVLGFALDLDNDTLEVYKNGRYYGLVATNLSGTYYPTLGGTGFNGGGTANFGQLEFYYEAPEGFEYGFHDGSDCAFSGLITSDNDMTVDNPVLNLFLGILLFYLVGFFVMWIFKKK